MIRANENILRELDALAEARKDEILKAKDILHVTGISYYVSASGDDENDGKTPETAWKTLDRVSAAELAPGDGVFFKRGDIFRGFVKAKEGVTYAAYGEGEKPRFYGWEKNLADPALWEKYGESGKIWRLKEKILDCGTLVFNGGEAHSRKLIPSYIGGRFVCRDDESRVFDVETEMTEDLDIFCRFEERLTEKPSRGESFPIPHIDNECEGELYLRCDKGNPAEVYSDIEALPRRYMFRVGNQNNIRIDNLCLKYIGTHAISAGGACVEGLCVTNCEIGWVGGAIQHYYGTDPNYPEGGRGTVTRFGNGVEIYGGCDGYEVRNCYIYEVYDAGITHQVTTFGKTYEMKNIAYRDNLIERCVYAIEYFLEKNGGDTESYMDSIEISGNILRFSGYGWGQQRHNIYTPAHIKGWSYENTASNFTVKNNIFDRSAYRMLHLVAKNPESCPKMDGNTYVQKLGMTLGQYGANEEAEPANHSFDERVCKTVSEIFCDKNAKVYGI